MHEKEQICVFFYAQTVSETQRRALWRVHRLKKLYHYVQPNVVVLAIMHAEYRRVHRGWQWAQVSHPCVAEFPQPPRERAAPGVGEAAPWVPSQV